MTFCISPIKIFGTNGMWAKMLKTGYFDMPIIGTLHIGVAVETANLQQDLMIKIVN